MKWLKVVVLVLIVMVLGCGCLPTLSLDEYGYVLFVGVDPGSLLPYEVTMMLQRAENNADAQEPTGVLLLSAECNDIFEAVDLLSASVPYQLNMARVTGMVFSQELAQNGQMHNFLDMSFGRLRMRHYVNIMVSKCSAQTFLKGMESSLDPAIAKLQINFLTYSRQTGLVPICNLSLWDEAIANKTTDAVVTFCGYDEKAKPLDGEQKQSPEPTKTPVTTPTPTPVALPEPDSVNEEMYAYLPDELLRQGGLQSILMGAALFNEEKMVGYLDGHHTQLLMMANGQFEKGRVQLTDPNGEYMSITLLKQQHPQIKLDINACKAHVKIMLLADVDVPEAIENVSVEELQVHIETYLEENIQKVFRTCQKLGADSFGMGTAALANFSTNEAWETFDWDSAYQNLQVVFEISVKLGHHPEKSNLE